MVEPDERVFINPLVCEGCGDCGVQSNCVSILPLETEFGRKRIISQSTCNKDYSCVNGFCPSFVTVKGGHLRKLGTTAALIPSDSIPQPNVVKHDGTYNILITGIGGTGVITIGALLGMAAHLEGKGASVLDMTGMSQKNGAVMSHVRLASNPQNIKAQRIATGEADLILGCDLLTAGSPDVIAKSRPDKTYAIINTHEQPPGQFARNPDWTFPTDSVEQLLTNAVGGQIEYINATKIATGLLGDAIGANLFMLGLAYQRGMIPLSFEAIVRAIELNGVAVNMNLAAFSWGRQAALNLQEVERKASPMQPVLIQRPGSLEHILQLRTEFLTQYQNAAYAQRYLAFVKRVRNAENAAGLGEKFTREVATYLFKLMSYKDEYEVARLFTTPEFQQVLNETFEGDFVIEFNLAPPLLAKRDAEGKLLKRRFPGITMQAFKILAKLRFLRGSFFDVFGRTEERRTERQLITEYEHTIEMLLTGLSAKTHSIALSIAKLPEHIRGYGHVKEASIVIARARQKELLSQIDNLIKMPA